LEERERMNSKETVTQTDNYSIFQKLVYLLVTPLFFTLLLFFVLLSMFDHGSNVLAHRLLSLGSNVPFLQKLISKPKIQRV
jgi:hypothetical protein